MTDNTLSHPRTFSNDKPLSLVELSSKDLDQYIIDKKSNGGIYCIFTNLAPMDKFKTKVDSAGSLTI